MGAPIRVEVGHASSCVFGASYLAQQEGMELRRVQGDGGLKRAGLGETRPLNVEHQSACVGETHPVNMAKVTAHRERFRTYRRQRADRCVRQLR